MKDDHGLKVDDGRPLTPLQRLFGYVLMVALWVFAVMGLIGVPLAALYALVRFIHWAWY